MYQRITEESEWSCQPDHNEEEEFDYVSGEDGFENDTSDSFDSDEEFIEYHRDNLSCLSSDDEEGLPGHLQDDGGKLAQKNSEVADDDNNLLPASPQRCDDKEWAIRTVSLNGNTFLQLSHHLQADKDVAMAAVRDVPSMIFRMPESMQSDKEVVLASLKIKGTTPRQATSLAAHALSNHLRDDEEVVVAAVSRSGRALQYAAAKLCDNKSVVLAAVSADGTALQYASKRLRQDRECVLTAVHQSPTSLQYALGGLNQDQDCLVAAGLWDEWYETKIQENQETQFACENLVPKIVLSTKFSLSAESSTTATEFTVFLKRHPYISSEKGGFLVYSPNAFDKDTCDPQWTRLDWPCRGTLDTCEKPNVDETTNIPTSSCCWRFSYRYQLQQARDNGGFMIQVVELDQGQLGKHKLGGGQEIEVLMAQEVGIKLFRIYEPIAKLGSEIQWRRPFQPQDIDTLVSRIRAWQEGCPSDLSIAEVHCP